MASSSVDLTGSAASNLAQQTAQASAMQQIAANAAQEQGETSMAAATDRSCAKISVDGMQSTTTLCTGFVVSGFKA